MEHANVLKIYMLAVQQCSLYPSMQCVSILTLLNVTVFLPNIRLAILSRRL